MNARLRLWWRALVHRRRFESELSEELAFHVHARRDALLAQGLAPGAALRQARIELGAVESHRDDCRRARGLALFDRIQGDLRYALRGLVRNPGYSATALAVLGVAIAANALLFALFNAYALRDPPLQRVERWVSVDARGEQAQRLSRWSPADADLLLNDVPPAFEGLYGFRGLRLPVRAAESRTVSAEAVTDNYFELLGVPAARGRTFRTGLERADGPGLVLSDLGWRRLTHADPDAVGGRIEVAGRSFEVLGVTPPGFSGLTVNASLLWLREADYRTFAAEPGEYPLQLDVGGFLREGANPEAAAAALTPRLVAGNPGREEALRVARVEVQARRGYLRADEREELVELGIPAAIAFAMLLLVAAANLANLVLARFAARQRELAVRVAVGAPRNRLVTQLMTESVLLAAIAAVFGFIVAWLALAPLNAALVGLLGELGFDMIDVAVDARVLLYGLGLALLAALAFGGLPALAATSPWRRGRAGAPDPAALQRAGRGRLRGVLMVAQLVASVILLVVASLATHHAREAEQVKLGYDPTRLIALRTAASGSRFTAELARLPEVEAVGATSSVFLMNAASRLDVRIGDRSEALAARRVDAAYFDAMQLEVLRGRALQPRDAPGSAVVVISRRTAERLWPGADPIGRTIDIAPQEVFAGLQAGHHEVVGVVEDVVGGWYISGVDASALYLPAAVGDTDLGSLLLRVRDTSPSTLHALRETCARMAPNESCELLPLSSALRLQRLPFQITSSASAALGATALGISCLGLYGLVSFLVLQKRREIGVRLALGAQAGRVAREVLRGSLRQIVLGIAIGLPLAFGVARMASSLHSGIRSFDATSFVLVPLLLTTLALVAAWIPARRSAGVAPTVVLRQE